MSVSKYYLTLGDRFFVRVYLENGQLVEVDEVTQDWRHIENTIGYIEIEEHHYKEGVCAINEILQDYLSGEEEQRMQDRVDEIKSYYT